MANAESTRRKKEELPPELTELRSHVERLPQPSRDKLTPLCDKVAYFVSLQTRLIRIAQEAIDQLHVDNRYLLFDVEATRRERDALRAELRDWEEE